MARGTIALVIGIAAVGGFAGVFLLAAVGGGTTLAVLAIVAGVALVVAGLSGGARWLIAPALVLVLPLAIVAAADIRVDGGIGERHYRPATVHELRPSYELGMGELVVDLRDVDLPAGTTRGRRRASASATPSCACPRMRACPPTCRSARATRRCSTALERRPRRRLRAGGRADRRLAAAGCSRARSASARSRSCAATTRCRRARELVGRQRRPRGRPAREGDRADRLSIVAGLAICGLGVVLLLDRTGVIDMRLRLRACPRSWRASARSCWRPAWRVRGGEWERRRRARRATAPRHRERHRRRRLRGHREAARDRPDHPARGRGRRGRSRAAPGCSSTCSPGCSSPSRAAARRTGPGSSAAGTPG